MKNNRLQYVDRLKGLAILLVVIGHVYLYTYRHPDLLENKYITSFHVPLFMFVSGFLVFNNNHIHTLKQLWDKLIKFVVPMITVGLIFTFTQSCFNSFCDIFLIIKQFIFDPGKNGYWYLMSLSFFYCTLQLFKLNKKKFMAIDIVIVLVVYVLLSIGRHIVLHKFCLWYDPFCFFNNADFYPFFILGYFARKYKWIEFFVSHNWIPITAFVSYILFFNLDFDVQIFSTLSERFIIRICALIAIITLFAKRETSNSIIESFLSYCGRNTLYIYVFHYFVVRNLSWLYADIWENSYYRGGFMLLALIIALIAIITSIKTGQLIKKTKIHKLLFT